MPQTTPPREDLFGQLVGLARSAHVNVDLEDPADYWYRLGQRNAYAHAAGMCLAPAADPRHFTVADRITAGLSDGVTDLDALTRSRPRGSPRPPGPDPGPRRTAWSGSAPRPSRPGTASRRGSTTTTACAGATEPGHPDLPAPPHRRDRPGCCTRTTPPGTSTPSSTRTSPPTSSRPRSREALTADPRMPAEQFAMLVHRHEQTRQIDAAPRPVLGVQP